MNRNLSDLTHAYVRRASVAIAGGLILAVSSSAAAGQSNQRASQDSENNTAATEVSSVPAKQIIIDAAAAQEDGDFKKAVDLWLEALNGELPASVQCKTHFNAGLCFSQLRDFENSIVHFEKGLKVTTPESAAEVPQALFYLGYAQLELGRQLQSASAEATTDEEQEEQRKQRAMELLTTSSQTLGRLQRRFPSFSGCDQAAFFQAKAFESLGRLEEAADSYRTSLSFDWPTFEADAQFGLADTLEKLGQSDEALQQYLSLIINSDTLSAQQKPLLVESQFRAAEVLMKLGEARRDSGTAKAANEDFASAFELYSAVVEQDANPQLVPLAMYGAAWSQLSTAVGESKPDSALQADKWFTRLIEAYPKHNLIADASAGRESARQLVSQLGLAAGGLTAAADRSDSAEVDENARMEIGLAHVKSEDWSAAINAFEGLIRDFPDSQLIDRFRYELAWAFRSATPPMNDESLKQFSIIAEDLPESSFNAEAHFHLGSADYDSGRFESASSHFAKVLNSDLPDTVVERASYKLGWSEYRLENYSAAADQFGQQLKVFPTGALATDAKVMFAESQFQQDKHSDALEAYLVAKPAVDADGNIDPKMQMLTALHGAQSANESQEFDKAIQFAMPVTQSDHAETYHADAWLEIGVAQAGKGNGSIAIDAWQRAAASMSVTGARARCLLGESLARAQKYQDALNQYKLVYFGFGGVDADEDVRPWQAFALYEAARLNQSLCKEAVGPVLRQRIAEAISQYDRLLDHYSDNELAAEAKRQLEKLKQF